MRRRVCLLLFLASELFLDPFSAFSVEGEAMRGCAKRRALGGGAVLAYLPPFLVFDFLLESFL